MRMVLLLKFLLFSGQQRPALGALLLYTGRSTFMRLTMPAFRAQTVTERTTGSNSTHATLALSSSTTPAYAPHSATSVSIHYVILM
jgi:hypothetical protein